MLPPLSSLGLVQSLARIPSQVCFEKFGAFGDGHVKVVEMLDLDL